MLKVLVYFLILEEFSFERNLRTTVENAIGTR